MYDLAVDPGERTNLIDDSPDVLEEIRLTVDEHERHIDETDTDVEQVRMDEEVKQQLRDLGYKE